MANENVTASPVSPISFPSYNHSYDPTDHPDMVAAGIRRVLDTNVDLQLLSACVMDRTKLMAILQGE